MSTFLDEDTTTLDETVADECKCEYNHILSTCSTEVTHIIWTVCGNRALTCANGAAVTSAKFGVRGKCCNQCGRHPDDCWHVVPV